LIKIKNKKLKKSSKEWVSRQNRDFYVKKAREIGYRSRSSFKLLDIHEKFSLIKNNINILELGSSPGGWSQVYSKINSNGKNLAIDILPMKEIDNIIFHLGDFKEISIQKKINDFFGLKNLDILLSDMAPNATGNKEIDSIKINSLAVDVLNFSLLLLSKNGWLITKYYSGKDEKDLIATSKKNFKKTNLYKPLSSRKDSKEMYLVSCGLI